jgi:phospholipase C
VRSANDADSPRTYTVEPHKNLSGVWSVAATGAADYDLSVSGPNGFLRAFKGGVSVHRRANLDVQAIYDEESNGIGLAISNLGPHQAKVSVFNAYTRKSIEQELEPGESISKAWSLKRMYGWYDLVITVESDAGFEYHVAGHVESGEDSISDPAMAGLI